MEGGFRRSENLSEGKAQSTDARNASGTSGSASAAPGGRSMILSKRIALASVVGMMVSGSAMAGLSATVNASNISTPTPDGSITPSDGYAGSFASGNSGFGGPFGQGKMHVANDLSKFYFGFSNMGDISGNAIRIYFDTKSGGTTQLSSAAGYNDNGDFGREMLSRPARDGLNLPFAADYGFIISPAFGGFSALFELTPGGGNSLTYNPGSSGTAVGENPSNGSYEFSIDLSALGVSAGDNIDFVVVYANHGGFNDGFVSNESIPVQFGDNPGNGPVTVNDFARYASTSAIPEPAALSLLGVPALMLLRRR